MKNSYFSSTKNLHMQKTKCFQKSIFFNFYYIKYAESDMEKWFALTIPPTRASSIDFRYKWKINIFHQQKKCTWKNENFQISIFFQICYIKYEDSNTLNSSVVIICSRGNFLRRYGTISFFLNTKNLRSRDPLRIFQWNLAQIIGNIYVRDVIFCQNFKNICRKRVLIYVSLLTNKTLQNERR